MWIVPQSCELTPLWSDVKSNDFFLLQKSKSETGNKFIRGFVGTIQNLSSTRQAPFRILIKPIGRFEWRVIAVANSAEEIENDWKWIEFNVLPTVETLETLEDKEIYFTSKFESLSSKIDAAEDDKFLTATRAFQSTFKFSTEERLVNFYACAIWKNKFVHQGWMYLSENFLCFYSYILGSETKLMIPLREIVSLTKEKSLLLPNAIKITTISKEEHFFLSFFHRDSTFEVIQLLTSQAIQRFLNSTPTTTSLPGSSTHINKVEEHNKKHPHSEAKRTISLRDDLHHQKRNNYLCSLFRLPFDEMVDAEYTAKFWIKSLGYIDVEIFITKNYLCFNGGDDLKIVVPFLLFKKLQKINTDSIIPSVSIVIRDIDQIISLEIKGSRDDFCADLKTHLQEMPRQGPAFDHFMKTNNVKLNQKKGLGFIYGFADDPPESSEFEEKKEKAWAKYFDDYGRGMSIIRSKGFRKLVKYGIPNRLRAELWEVMSGGVFERGFHPDYFETILEKNKGVVSLSTEEIEKDLRRSLPEHPAFQVDEGIDKLRRVLYAYSFRNPEVGYCQAMNLFTSVLLLFLGEEQTFWVLCSVCNRMLPGYYTTNMVGAVVDQRVFETLIEKHLPLLAKHFTEKKIQLSIACLPWFLTQFTLPMPLKYACRVLDCFFMDGVKFLFQLAMNILKRNMEVLLEISDDGEMLSIFKEYFLSLSEPAKNYVPENESTYIPSEFDVLLLSAMKEFSAITEEVVLEVRASSRLRVAHTIGDFSKKLQIRALKEICTFSDDELQIIYKKFHTVRFFTYSDQGNKDNSYLDFLSFYNFLTQVTEWANLDEGNKMIKNEKQLLLKMSEETGSHLIKKIFDFFDCNKKGRVTMEELVIGLQKIIKGDLLSRIDTFFTMHDTNQDSIITKDEVLHISESFLFFFRNEKNTVVSLSAISNFMNISFQMLETQQNLNFFVESQDQPPKQNSNPNSRRGSDFDSPSLSYAETKRNQEYSPTQSTEQINNHEPGQENSILSMSAFRAVILAVPFLEQFFEVNFPTSFHLTHANELKLEKAFETDEDQLVELINENMSLKKMVDGIVVQGKKAKNRLSQNRLGSTLKRKVKMFSEEAPSRKSLDRESRSSSLGSDEERDGRSSFDSEKEDGKGFKKKGQSDRWSEIEKDNSVFDITGYEKPLIDIENQLFATESEDKTYSDIELDVEKFLREVDDI